MHELSILLPIWVGLAVGYLTAKLMNRDNTKTVTLVFGTFVTCLVLFTAVKVLLILGT